jgi:hypothetical protein
LDKSLFIPGLIYLVDHLKPSTLILYGTLTEEIKSILEDNDINYLYFPSEISEAMEAKYGNERK